MLSDITLQDLPKDFQLRPVQKLSIDMLRESFKRGNKRSILHLATSGGKTILAGMLFRKVFERNPSAQCWFIAPRITLLNQTKAEFERIFGFDCGIVQGNTKIDLSKHVQISTIQTLASRLNSDDYSIYTAFRELPVAMVAADEAHLKFAGYETVKEAWNSYIVGLTATPFSKGLGNFYQDMVRPKRMAELIQEGVIADYRVRSCISIDRNNLSKTTKGEFKETDIEKESTKIIGDVFKEWSESEDAKGRPFLGFTTTISTCIALSNHFNEQGANTAFVHSKMSDEDVQSILDAFKGGYYDGIFSVVKLIEGFDFPAASMMIDCAPLAPSKDDPNIPNSAARYVQKLGRVVRKHDSKDYALVHDHASNFIQFGNIEYIEDLFPVLDTDNGKEKKELTAEERKERVVKECPKCHMIMKGIYCNICGHVLSKPTQFLEAGDLKFIDGKMIEIKKSDTARTNKKVITESRADFCAMLKFKVKEHLARNPTANIKGMYAHKYKNYFGVWPRGTYNYESVIPSKPSDAFSNWYLSQNIRYAKRASK